LADMALNEHLVYKTWYDFKRKLESELGRGLPVDLWLRTKPRKPLPWDETDLRVTLSEVARIQQYLPGKLNHSRSDRGA
jgi:hypothetical protein